MTPPGHLRRSEAAAVRASPKSRNKPVKRQSKVAKKDEAETVRPAVGTLARTKRLLLAALKVWELKNGIRE